MAGLQAVDDPKSAFRSGRLAQKHLCTLEIQRHRRWTSVPDRLESSSAGVLNRLGRGGDPWAPILFRIYPGSASRLLGHLRPGSLRSPRNGSQSSAPPVPKTALIACPVRRRPSTPAVHRQLTMEANPCGLPTFATGGGALARRFPRFPVIRVRIYWQQSEARSVWFQPSFGSVWVKPSPALAGVWGRARLSDNWQSGEAMAAPQYRKNSLFTRCGQIN